MPEIQEIDKKRLNEGTEGGEERGKARAAMGSAETGWPLPTWDGTDCTRA